MAIRTKRIVALTGVAAVAAIAAATGAMATTSGSTTHGGIAPTLQNGLTVTPPRTPVDHVSEQLRNTFGVLRSEKRPSAPRHPPGAVAPGRFGANAKLAVPVASAVGIVWIVPGDGALCLARTDAGGAGGGCASLAQARAGGLVDITLRFAHQKVAAGRMPAVTSATLVGVVPDGVDHVTVHSADGSHRIPVADNVYAATVSDPTSVSFVNGSGTTIVHRLS